MFFVCGVFLDEITFMRLSCVVSAYLVSCIIHPSCARLVQIHDVRMTCYKYFFK